MARDDQELHTITLMGREFRIRSEADREHLEEVARYVEETIDTVARGQRHLAVQNILLLAALNLADELFSSRADHEALQDRIRASSHALLERLAPAA
ncbi:MAG: cell division protein ZapA [Myxococcota bacterium]